MHHDHEHCNCHEHHHDHDHGNCGCHNHDHDHHHCSCGCHHQPDPMDELVALMKYMVGHNAAHARELADLAEKLDKAGNHDVVTKCILRTQGANFSTPRNQYFKKP